jgi:hypothetical protein
MKTAVQARKADWKAVSELSRRDGPCLSMYLGPHQAGAGTRPRGVRLRAMLAGLEQNGAGLEELLEPLRGLAQDAGFDGADHGGLAVFRSSRDLEIIGLPAAVQDEAHFSRRFFLLPVLEFLREHKPFHLLAISRKRMRLLRATPHEVEEAAFPAGVPSTWDEAVGLDEPENTLTHSSLSGHAAGSMGGVHFGSGAVRDKQDRYFSEFCRAVERGLRRVLDAHGLPLVLAGTESELAHYREINTYPELAQPAVTVSPDGGISDEQLAGRARALLRDWLDAEERHAVELFANSSVNHIATETNGIVKAAWEGRVSHLMIAAGHRQAGQAGVGESVKAEEDLANAAAVETLSHGGSVVVLPGEAMPEGRLMAALLRY